VVCGNSVLFVAGEDVGGHRSGTPTQGCVLDNYLHNTGGLLVTSYILFPVFILRLVNLTGLFFFARAFTGVSKTWQRRNRWTACWPVVFQFPANHHSPFSKPMSMREKRLTDPSVPRIGTRVKRYGRFYLYILQADRLCCMTWLSEDQTVFADHSSPPRAAIRVGNESSKGVSSPCSYPPALKWALRAQEGIV
jgi:hypothetical protein